MESKYILMCVVGEVIGEYSHVAPMVKRAHHAHIGRVEFRKPLDEDLRPTSCYQLRVIVHPEIDGDLD